MSQLQECPRAQSWLLRCRWAALCGTQHRPRASHSWGPQVKGVRSHPPLQEKEVGMSVLGGVTATSTAPGQSHPWITLWGSASEYKLCPPAVVFWPSVHIWGNSWMAAMDLGLYGTASPPQMPEVCEHPPKTPPEVSDSLSINRGDAVTPSTSSQAFPPTLMKELCQPPSVISRSPWHRSSSCGTASTVASQIPNEQTPHLPCGDKPHYHTSPCRIPARSGDHSPAGDWRGLQSPLLLPDTGIAAACTTGAGLHFI